MDALELRAILPSSTVSSSFSMRAVNFVSTMSGNLSSISFVTTLPSGVMRRNLPSLTTYSRSMMVETVGA